MKRQKTTVVLASGGFDSAALLGWGLQQNYRVQPVYCRFGLRWEQAECHWLKKLLHAIQTPALLPLVVLETSTKALYSNHWSLTGKNVPGYRSQDPSVYLPGRNALLLSLTAVYAARQRINEIWMGTLGSNPFPDATPLFFKTMGRALSLALGTPLQVKTPFQKWTKEKVLQLFQDFPLKLAFSCLNPKGVRHCGACNKCAERDRALKFLSLR